MGENLELPERMFASGEEPKGLRVTSYGPSNGIKVILNALEEEERNEICRSTFGKFVSIAEKLAYSGRSGRFLISRQLKVGKKHEIWVLYAGKPIRFSLREFVIVTGLPCGKFPKKSKKQIQNNITETPYWPSLFGKLESVSVASVIKMLKRKTVTDKETRVKYACLAILALVLMPTTHHPKIVKAHAEEIKELKDFFLYPWGRLAFDMLMSSIKERNEISLSQNTIAIKGFVHALQLVIVEAVPALLEVVQLNSTSDYESEGDGEKPGSTEKKISLSPSHARDLHEEEKTLVDCVISDDGEKELDERDFAWSDDEDDVKVNNLLQLINEDHEFCSKMFTGGSTKADVARMIKEAKDKAVRGKQKKGVAAKTDGECGASADGVSLSDHDVDRIAELVACKIKGELKSLVDLGLMVEFRQLMKKMKTEVVDSIIAVLEKPYVHNTNNTVVLDSGNTTNRKEKQATADRCIGGTKEKEGLRKRKDAVNEIIGSVLGDLRSLPLQATGEEAGFQSGEGGQCSEVGDNDVCDDGIVKETKCDDEALKMTKDVCEHGSTEVEEETVGFGDCGNVAVGGAEGIGERGNFCRKSKRQKLIPAALVGDYQCDKRFLQRGREDLLTSMRDGNAKEYGDKYKRMIEKLQCIQHILVGGVSISVKDFVDIACRTKSLQPKVVDFLIWQTRSWVDKQSSLLLKTSVFLDTKFAPALIKNYSKFAKLPKKEAYQFQKQLTQTFTGENATNIDADRFYFPFNFDKTHWVGICVDCLLGIVEILDSDVAIRSESQIEKELSPLAELFPYFLKQCGRVQASKDVKSYALGRAKNIPQNRKPGDSAVTTVLLLQSHAVGGIDACGWVTHHVLAAESQRLPVMIFEEFCDGV